MSGMQGKVVVLTGGTSGIGEAAAIKLTRMGARLVLVARDEARAKAAIKRLQKISPGIAPPHTAHLADLSLVDETRRVAREIAATEPRIDVLINNAGLICARRQVTVERYELTFATNHLAYFVLTHGLLPRMLASAPARIVNTASEVHRGAMLDFGDLQSEHGYSGFGAYAKSKLANVLFTSELARRLFGSGVTANSLHPGVVSAFRAMAKAEIHALPAFSPLTASPRKKALRRSSTWRRRLTRRRRPASISTNPGPSCRPKQRRIGPWLRSYGRNQNIWGESNTK
jgi:NAD(P)-dependent dehydrogenase (short-subunit alcohol dehydrogenase family)